MALVLTGCSGGAIQLDIPIPSIQLPDFGNQATATPRRVDTAAEPPTFSQSDERWGDDQLGPSPETLASAGCYVTSVAILFDAYSPGYTDPGRLNAALTDANGFLADGSLKWRAATEQRPSTSSFEFLPNRAFRWAKVDSELEAGRPVLVNVTGTRNHMVVIWEKRGSGKSTTYSVIDPLKGGSYTWPREGPFTGDLNTTYEIGPLTLFAPPR